MADPVAICNVALGAVGGKLISSLDDSSTEAKLCSALFASLRDEVLERKRWTFATGRLTLTPDALDDDETAEVAVSGFAARFTFPTTVIAVRECRADSADDLDWRREGQAIVTEDVPLVRVVATMRVEDASLFSPAFASALSARLAAALAIPLTENRPLESDQWALFERLLKTGGATDGMQGRSDVVRASTIARARR